MGWIGSQVSPLSFIAKTLFISRVRRVDPSPSSTTSQHTESERNDFCQESGRTNCAEMAGDTSLGSPFFLPSISF